MVGTMNEGQSTRLLKPREVAERLQVTPRAIRYWVHQGLIPHIRLSQRAIRFDPAAVDDWLEQRTQKAS
jgi:excisionase family DNA binding protein